MSISIGFQRNSLLQCVSQPKIAKKFHKTAYFGIQGHSLNWAPIESQCTTSY